MRYWLKNLRDEKSLTMKDVASKLGISESYYCLIEKGERQKKMDMILVSGLSSVLGIPISKIIQEERRASK